MSREWTKGNGWHICTVRGNEADSLERDVERFWQEYALTLMAFDIPPDWEYLHIVIQSVYGEFSIRTWKNDQKVELHEAAQIVITSFCREYEQVDVIERGRDMNLDRGAHGQEKRAMPRQLRIEYPGACYHVMARGDRREAIFGDDVDREGFVSALGEVCARTGWRLHAWVLMSNHYHALLETPQPNLVAGMQWLQTTYTMRFNRRHRLSGHLFGGRYKAVLVEDGNPAPTARVVAPLGYWGSVMDYIHLNPARAGLVKLGEGEGLLGYPWSSVVRGYSVPPTRRAPWMAVATGFGLFGLRDTVAGRRRFVERIEARMGAEEAERCGLHEIEGQSLQSTLRRGWYFGSQGFRESVLELARAGGLPMGRRGDHYEGTRAQRDHSEAEAGRLLLAGAAQLGLALESSNGWLRCDWRRGLMAALLRQRTTVSLGWLAQHLDLKSSTNVSHQMARALEQAKSVSAAKRAWAALRALS